MLKGDSSHLTGSGVPIVAFMTKDDEVVLYAREEQSRVSYTHTCNTHSTVKFKNIAAFVPVAAGIVKLIISWERGSRGNVYKYFMPMLTQGGR